MYRLVCLILNTTPNPPGMLTIVEARRGYVRGLRLGLQCHGQIVAGAIICNTADGEDIQIYFVQHQCGLAQK